MTTWPRELLPSRALDWSPASPNQAAPASLAGIPQGVFLTGGPFWTLDLDGVLAEGRAAILAFRALQGLLEGGASIALGPCDLSAGAMVASFGADAALRAVAVTLAVSRPVIAGEQFAVDNVTWGRRMHRIISIEGGTPLAPQVKLRPPLREAATAGQACDFDNPSCLMQLAGAFQLSAASPGLADQQLLGKASFVEYPGKAA